MNDTSEHIETNSERLRADYREAFNNWANQVSRVGAADACANAYVEAAEHVYRESRDRLSEAMGQRVRSRS